MIFNLTIEQLNETLKKGDVKVAVFGLGKVGLPLAIAWLRAGQKVIGVDISQPYVDKINNGVSPIMDEPYIPEAVKKFVSNGRFYATTDLVKASRDSDVKLIIVPTTSKQKMFYKEPLEKALRSIGKGLKRGDAITIECTVPPRTTEDWARPILEEESKLKAEEDFALAFSQERIYEGRALEDIEEHYPKVIGGIGPRSTQIFSVLYSHMTKKGVITMSNSTAAELSKIYEGIYRDVNIALANELAKLCDGLDVDFTEIRAASNSQPFCHLHMPGTGVGGACIPYYPYFALEKAEDIAIPMPLTKLARHTNEKMPEYIVSLAQEAVKKIGKDFSKIKIAVLGLAFRGDVCDTRDSPTYDLVNLLEKLETNIVVHDPFVNSDEILGMKGIQLVQLLDKALENASLVIIATDHREYRNINLREVTKKLKTPFAIIDGRNVIKIENIPKGLYLAGIGRKTINML